mgnify:FL=1
MKQHEMNPENVDFIVEAISCCCKSWDLEAAKGFCVKLQRVSGTAHQMATVNLAIAMQKGLFEDVHKSEDDEEEKKKKKKLSGELAKAMFARIFKSTNVEEYRKDASKQRDLSSEIARAYITALKCADMGFKTTEEKKITIIIENRKVAIAFLESEVGKACFAKSSPLERLRLLAELSESIGEKLKAFEYNADIIHNAPDDWIAIVKAIEMLSDLGEETKGESRIRDALEHLAKLGLNDDNNNNSSSSSSSSTTTTQFALALRNKSELNGGAKVVGRGPYLAVIEAARKNLSRTNNDTNARVLSDAIADYVDKFATWTSCARELRTFMEALMDSGNSEAIKTLRERLAKRRDIAVTLLDEYYENDSSDDGDIVDEAKYKVPMDALRVETACRVLDADVSRDEIGTAWFSKKNRMRYLPPIVFKTGAGIERARVLMDRFEMSEKLVESLDSREWAPRDSLALSATHALVAEAASRVTFSSSEEDSAKAVMFLCAAKSLSKRILLRSKHNAAALFDEISSSCLLGASKTMLDTFIFLDAKNIQMASLVHHVAPALDDGNSVTMADFRRIYVRCAHLQQQADGDIGESFAKALNHGAFDKALEFSSFRDVLKRSFAFSQADTFAAKFAFGLAIEEAWSDEIAVLNRKSSLLFPRRLADTLDAVAAGASNGILSKFRFDRVDDDVSIESSKEEKYREEQEIVNRWKSRELSHTDDAMGTNSSWFPPSLHAPSLASASWFLAAKCANFIASSSSDDAVEEEFTTSTYRDVWSRNQSLESLSYFIASTVIEGALTAERIETLKTIYQHTVLSEEDGSEKKSSHLSEEKNNNMIMENWLRTNVYAFNETFIEAFISKENNDDKDVAGKELFAKIAKIAIESSCELAKKITEVSRNPFLPNSVKFAIDGLIGTISYISSHVLTVSSIVLVSMARSAQIDFKNDKQNPLLAPVKESIEVLLAALCEDAIELLKACNEEDDAHAGITIAQSIACAGVTNDLATTTASDVRKNHLATLELAAKRIQCLRNALSI